MDNIAEKFHDNDWAENPYLGLSALALFITEYYDVKVHFFQEISAGLSEIAVQVFLVIRCGLFLKFYNEDGT